MVREILERMTSSGRRMMVASIVAFTVYVLSSVAMAFVVLAAIHSVLAGPVDLSSYAQVLRERAHGSSDIDGSESRKSPRKPDLGILYTGLGVLVIGTLVVTITFVHERRVLAPLREAPSSTRTEDPEPAP